MAKIDRTGKHRLSLNGKYVLNTAASKLWLVSPNGLEMHLILDKVSGGTSRTVIIEINAEVLMLDNNEYEIVRVGDYETFDISVV